MALLPLAGFGYLLSAGADGRSLGRMSGVCGENLPAAVGIAVIATELLLTFQAQPKACKRRGVCIRVAQISWWQQTEQRAGKEQWQKEGKKKEIRLAKMQVYYVSLLGEQECWEENQMWRSSTVPLCSSPNSHCLNDHFCSQTLPCAEQTPLSCSQVIKQALCCFMHHWNVFIWRLSRQLHVFPDLGGEKQSNELTPLEQR